MSSFPPWEGSGNQIRKWMENASEPGCKVARITLTLDTLSLDRSGWDIASSAEHLEPEHYKWLERVGIPTGVDKTSEESIYRGTMVMKSEGPLTQWTGVVGPGVIFINNVERAKCSDDPFISELTHAVYAQKFNLQDLKHIWVTDIQNHDTARFINNFIYAAGTELEYPRDAVITWNSSSPQYNALLGTALGKMVGCFILGAFGQGVKRISQICLFRSYGSPQLQFDIEQVETCQRCIDNFP
ncbi:hypothetical protein N7541_004322 [Penicillium brevicompactum]|uniref:Uncharacterized protein n=1 Tax=Penicillium brevicompactum TaxID=5074 RepID=A0A9W9RD84_PENBR|nr:hypothetical protein N7541_004322 [Penicillium brevicompactum]